MKIGLVSTPTGWGGGENLLAQLATGLQRAGAEIAIAAPSGSPLAEWTTRQPGASLLPLPGRGRTPAAMWRLRRWFTAERCEVALLNDPHAITYGGLALAGLGAPRVGVRHTVFPVRSAWKHTQLLEHVVAVSAAARDGCLSAGVPADRVRVIHGGVDPLPVSPAELQAARETFDQANTHPAERNLLAVGSLLPVKGFDTLLTALAQATEQGDSWRLWIAGEGPERESLIAQADALGVADRLNLLGFRKDVGALLAVADVLVSASHNEGLSLVLIEAMLAGRPIAATPVGGAREVLAASADDRSPYAWTFPPGDADAARLAIRRALSDSPERRLRIEAARTHAEGRFTIDRMAADYLSLFDELLGARSQRRAA